MTNARQWQRKDGSWETQTHLLAGNHAGDASAEAAMGIPGCFICGTILLLIPLGLWELASGTLTWTDIKEGLLLIATVAVVTIGFPILAGCAFGAFCCLMHGIGWLIRRLGLIPGCAIGGIIVVMGALAIWRGSALIDELLLPAAGIATLIGLPVLWCSLTGLIGDLKRGPDPCRGSTRPMTPSQLLNGSNGASMTD